MNTSTAINGSGRQQESQKQAKKKNRPPSCQVEPTGNKGIMNKAEIL